MLKVQRIEKHKAAAATRTVYHISIIGLRLPGSTPQSELPHAPVSAQTLNGSVTRLSRSTARFPEPAPGIAERRAANGGVFTIPVAEIAALMEQALAQQAAR